MNWGKCQTCGGTLSYNPRTDLKICMGKCKGVFLA